MAEILRMYRGDDRTFTLTVRFDGAVADLSTADEIRFTAKRRLSDAEAEAVVACVLFDGVELTTDGTDGKVDVTIRAADTASQGAGTVLLWDLEVTRTLASGIEPSVRTWPEDDSGIPSPGKLVLVGDVSGSAAS